MNISIQPPIHSFNFRYPDIGPDDPLHKYETIPLENTGFVKKQLNTGEQVGGGRYQQGGEGGGRYQQGVGRYQNGGEGGGRGDEEEEEEDKSDSVNYGYHPIIDFFTPYRD